MINRFSGAFYAIALTLTAILMPAGPAMADIIHAYVLIETEKVENDALLQGLGSDLGMCKYVVVGATGTEEIGISHTIVRLDCQETADLNALITHIGANIAGVTRVSVLEVFRAR